MLHTRTTLGASGGSSPASLDIKWHKSTGTEWRRRIISYRTDSDLSAFKEDLKSIIQRWAIHFHPQALLDTKNQRLARSTGFMTCCKVLLFLHKTLNQQTTQLSLSGWRQTPTISFHHLARSSLHHARYCFSWTVWYAAKASNCSQGIFDFEACWLYFRYKEWFLCLETYLFPRYIRCLIMRYYLLTYPFLCEPTLLCPSLVQISQEHNLCLALKHDYLQLLD